MANKKNQLTDKEEREIAKKEIDIIVKDANIYEPYFVGLMWGNPYENYSAYGNKISKSDFRHAIWAFYYEIGQKLYAKGLKKFDDISVHAMVNKMGVDNQFDEYNGIKTIEDMINITMYNEMNIESYYESIVKHSTITKLFKLFGSKVLVDNGAYNYREMSSSQLLVYWGDKLQGIGLSNISNFESENLYIESEDFIEDLETKTEGLLPFYRSNRLNYITQGMPRGEVTIIGGFGNSGKSSFTVEKILTACIQDEDKTLIILNEEPARAWREKLILVILNHYFSDMSFSRKKFGKAKLLTDKDKDDIKKAFDKLYDLIEGDDAKIKVVHVEKYEIEDVKTLATFYANRGYVNLIIDTHKVPDDGKNTQRWERFTDMTKEIYKFTRKEAGGLNLRTILTIQLADNHISDRFLGFDAIGEGKGIKNEASTVIMFRPLFTDEYDTLEYFNYDRTGISGSDKPVVVKTELDKDKTYYVFFFPKNRGGSNTDNGQDPLLMEVNFDFNHFREVGYVKIPRNYQR